MPKYACFVLLAFCLLPPPTARATVCVYLTVNGVPVLPPLAGCLPLPPATVGCIAVPLTTGPAGAVLVICQQE
jgi:hypothetical protein